MKLTIEHKDKTKTTIDNLYKDDCIEIMKGLGGKHEIKTINFPGYSISVNTAEIKRVYME